MKIEAKCFQSRQFFCALVQRGIQHVEQTLFRYVYLRTLGTFIIWNWPPHSANIISLLLLAYLHSEIAKASTSSQKRTINKAIQIITQNIWRQVTQGTVDTKRSRHNNTKTKSTTSTKFGKMSSMHFIMKWTRYAVAPTPLTCVWVSLLGLRADEQDLLQLARCQELLKGVKVIHETTQLP